MKQTYRDNTENYHKCSLGYRRNLPIAISSQEKQSAKRDLLDIQPAKEMRNGFGEEQPARIGVRRLINLLRYSHHQLGAHSCKPFDYSLPMYIGTCR